MFNRLFGTPADTEAARQMVRDGATLLDVRTPEEFSGGHPRGALNIPVQVLPVRHHELDRTRPVVVYCHSGGRSASAARLLRKAGFETVVDIGPMPRW